HATREQLLDPFAGVDDLRAGVLRTVGAGADRFREDYLRILRALRFAGRFELAIEPSTWEAA
ncbi:MAG: CCA tRNA nucleotidyltransferase, partial [Gemmatimonadetes bacterium]|nr:CCA tRNA nucleotidyltransferase [Gemmatimonadota bacterium]NIQ57686.1 CCA tRNA nucleotidyltransferase [Gemmatimonadota bacterium]NIU77852.1 CCA tRNA nucleotidyltransferase [Gammaproteobacteria bacterium]NIX46969.1 CCA tRNA nucleotidyltransferase [Gemmatimonadota bacterium]